MPSHSIAAALKYTAPDISLVYGYQTDDCYDVIIRFHSAKVCDSYSIDFIFVLFSCIASTKN